MRDDFAVFILSHGRPDKVVTVSTILSSGYKGRWYIIIDNEDESAKSYYENYGFDHVIMFDKYEKSLHVDSCDVERRRNAVLYARESCFEIAERLGLTYFLELDDDYYEISSRVEKNDTLSSIHVKDLDSIINECIDFLDVSKAHCIAFSQMGDFIGGLNSSMYKNRVTRKAMNAFLCTTKRPFSFIGRMNDDVNTYVLEGSRGKLFLTIADVSINQFDTQKMKGGLSDMYMEYGTYVKSFFSVITNPSCVKVSEIGQFHKRLHHYVYWDNAVPRIIRECYKK